MFQKLRPLEDKKNFLSGNFCAQSALKADSGEKLVLRDQGLFQQMVSWKPGYFYLTTRRIIFAQGERIVFQRYLEYLEGVDIVKRRCILSKMVKQLRIISNSRVNFIAIRRVENWLNEIYKVFIEYGFDGTEK